MSSQRLQTLIIILFAGLITLPPIPAAGQQRKSRRPAKPSAQQAALTNEDIIKLVQAKVSDEVIIAKIKGSQTQFDLSTDGLVKLKQAGVSDRVLKAMMNPAAEAAPAAPSVKQPAAVTPPAPANQSPSPAQQDQPAASPSTGNPTNAKSVTNSKRPVLVKKRSPTPPAPHATISRAPANYGMYIEQGGELKPIGRIQTKVQVSKWRVFLGSRLPFVRQKIDLNIPGAHSDSRFEAERPAFYAFFPPSRDVSRFKLLQCKITGQRFDQRTVANLSILFSREQNQDEILCDVGPTPIKDLYRITPREDLPSGEYSFVEGNPGSQAATNVDIIDVWDFGIDLKDDKLGMTEYLDGLQLVSKGEVKFFDWSKDEAQKVIDAHAGQVDLGGKLQSWFKRQFSSLGVYWVDEEFADAFARLEMFDRSLTPEQATKLSGMIQDIDENHFYVLVSVGQKIGSGRLIGANEAERRMRPFDAVLYNAKDDDFIVPAKKMESVGGYAGVFKVTFERTAIKGPLLSASPDVYFEARLNQNLDLKARFKVEQISSKLAQNLK